MYNTPDTYSSNNPLIQDTLLDTKYVDPGYLFDKGYNFLDQLLSSSTLSFLNGVLAVLAIFFLAIIIYVTIRMFEIRKKEHEHFHHEHMEYMKHLAMKKEEVKEESKWKDTRWSNILNHLYSSNENDWRSAILEADNMLFDLLTQLGFQGETLGEKLKDANGDSFRSLSKAWEVHTIRNKIAHEGSSYEITSREAKRVIAIYESIFQDFGFI